MLAGMREGRGTRGKRVVAKLNALNSTKNKDSEK
jgi:hypothetical protein